MQAGMGARALGRWDGFVSSRLAPEFAVVYGREVTGHTVTRRRKADGCAGITGESGPGENPGGREIAPIVHHSMSQGLLVGGQRPLHIGVVKEIRKLGAMTAGHIDAR